MGLILPQKVKIKWNGTSKQHYIDLGYVYTKHGELFEVDVNHLSKGSCVIVKVKCDYCENIVNMEWKQYLSLRGNTYCCPECLKHKKKIRDENGNLIFIEIPYRNKKWLYNEYIVKDREAKDIADECGINLRTLREWISTFELNNKYQEKTRELSKDILEDLYFKQHKTSEEIGKIYRLSGNTIINVIRSYGFNIPSRSELMSTYLYEKGGIDKARETQSTMENRIKSSCRQRGIAFEDFNGFAVTEQHMARNNTYYKEWKTKFSNVIIILVNVVVGVVEI